ncbi:MAG: helix-turn-helix transcriptional regulator [Bacteriovorax sp.]|nr:helix-turn-helix transcriptional regulator [Bacteriovorax sp.]
METIKESLGQRLERLRKERNLTAKAMSRLIDIPESTYREWEYGRGLKLPPCQKISQVLGISVSELITGEGPKWKNHLEDLETLEQNLREIRLKLSSLI